MCFRSTIQNEECSSPLVKAVILTKWTSASRQRGTEIQTVSESGGSMKSLKEWDGENCGNLPYGLGLSDGHVGKAGRQPDGERLWKETGQAHLHIHGFLTFTVKFGRHEGCMTCAVQLLDGSAWCKWAYICFPCDKSEMLYAMYNIVLLA